ncbi:MAG: branched-chain amino acid ABC transporter ATP-binding protein/permease [Alphaproteobacteria bacterium]
MQALVAQRGKWIAAAALVAAVVLPLVLPSFYVHIMVLMVIFAIFAMSLDILMGYAGLPSLGHAAFYGTAAYVSGLLTARYGGSWWEGILLALVCCGLLAALFGFVALRTRGLYFLLITLALAQVLWGATMRWGSFTGGYNGLRGIPKHLEVLGGTHGAYYLALAIFIVLGGAMYLQMRSPFGLTLQGIRDSESRMQTLGYNVWLHKYLAFVISALFAGCAGVMSGYYDGFVSPFDLSLMMSADAILMVILGGTGTLIGPVIGAVVIVALRNFLSTLMDDWLIVLGVIFILTVFFAPNGVIGWFRGRKPESAAVASGGESPTETPMRDLTTAVQVAPAPSRATASSGVPDLRLDAVSKMFGGMAAVKDVSFEVQPGERVAILGPNGAGKTSLFHLISGTLRPSDGRVYLFGEDVTSRRTDQRIALGLGRTFQITNLFPSLTVLSNLRLALFSHAGCRYVMHRTVESLVEITERAHALLRDIGLWEVRDVEVRHLSYGHQRQLEVVLALALRPRILLLDEPTAGLSVAESAAVVRMIHALDRNITLLIIEHDMDVAFEVADKVMVFHFGEKLAEGTTGEIRANPDVRRIYLGRSGR